MRNRNRRRFHRLRAYEWVHTAGCQGIGNALAFDANLSTICNFDEFPYFFDVVNHTLIFVQSLKQCLRVLVKIADVNCKPISTGQAGLALMISISVDLPVPLPPMMPMRSSGLNS